MSANVSNNIREIALKIIDEIRNKIIQGKCSDDELIRAVAKLEANSNGYIDPKNLLTYDKAMDLVGVRNRTTFCELCKKNKIKNIKINNVGVGFKREDIERLKQIINTN